jgi:hypothetical protein
LKRREFDHSTSDKISFALEDDRRGRGKQAGQIEKV